MSGVVRYAHGKRNHVMTPAEDGAFVRSADYDTLRAQLKAAQTSVDRLTGMKFSERVHAALIARAEAAEAECARLAAVLEQIADSFDERYRGATTGEGHSDAIWAARAALAARTKEQQA